MSNNMERTRTLIKLPQCMAFVFSCWASKFPILLVVLLILGAFGAWVGSLVFIHQDAMFGATIITFACLFSAFYPHDYVFDEEGVWTEPRALLRLRANRKLLAKRSDIDQWQVTQWKGRPAILLSLRSGNWILLCYERQAQATENEAAVFRWLEMLTQELF